MVSELHSFIKADKVLFGTRECAKNAKNIAKVFVPKDIRADSLANLQKIGVEIKQIDMSKSEIADKIALDFFCEAFGVKKR